ncbi:MAG: adenylate/guanylate cyclase domain-containing protein [Chitinispirillales bacterium]|nr:adenylate/guanylate cyclase domain-containing protein [Chitinispirillales bacterium]
MKDFDRTRKLVKAIGSWLVLGIFFVSSLSLLIVSLLVNSQTERYGVMITELTQNHLTSTARALSAFVSVEELDRYHAIEDTYTPEYLEIKRRLVKFAEDYNVKYAFYWRDFGDGRLQYIVDNDFDPETKVDPSSFLEIAEVVERHALAGITGATDLGTYTPIWKGLITGYAPVYDDNGNIYGVAAVDASDSFIIAKNKEARNMTVLLLVTIPLSVIFGILNVMLYRKKAKQIEDAHTKLQYFNNNMRRAFSTYLSEEVVEEIVTDPTRLRLGGEKKYMTALFTDIKGFTRIAEALSPEKLVELLNYYLSTMSDVILDRRGTIDKYEGDAIIAFFGAPITLSDHALQASLTAILMKRLEGEINMYVAENSLSPFPLHTRIGINSGDMVVGNMGTHRKMNYTIVSNAVNLAARLEGVNKQYGTMIIASEDTVKETQGRLLTRRLDRIRVVGINEPVRIYEILETKDDASTAMQEMVSLFNKAHGLFEDRNWKDALDMFNKGLELFPDDKPSLLFRDRCQTFIQSPPAGDWDGVFKFEEK